LGIIYSRLGEHSIRGAKAARTAGKPEAARLFQQAVDYDRLSSQTVAHLVQIDAKNNTYRRLVAIAANNLGEALLEVGDTKAAVLEISNGLTYFSENAKTDPANLNAKYELALSIQNYIRALLRDGQVPEARKQFAGVVELTEEIISKDSKNREYMNSAVTLREELGDGLLALGNFAEALEQYRAARIYADKIIVTMPAVRQQYESRFDEKFGDYYVAMAEHQREQTQKRREYWSEAKNRYQAALDNTSKGPRADAIAQKIARCDKAISSN